MCEHLNVRGLFWLLFLWRVLTGKKIDSWTKEQKNFGNPCKH